MIVKDVVQKLIVNFFIDTLVFWQLLSSFFWNKETDQDNMRFDLIWSFFTNFSIMINKCGLSAKQQQQQIRLAFECLI